MIIPIGTAVEHDMALPITAIGGAATSPPPLQINVYGTVRVGDTAGTGVYPPAGWWRRVPRLAWTGLGALLTFLSNLDRILRLIERAPEWYEKVKELLRDL